MITMYRYCWKNNSKRQARSQSLHKSGQFRLWIKMSLLKQQNSGQQFDTFFCDESDGSLDIENATRYAALYPAFMKIANLESLVFISHQAPARTLADHVLQFRAGEGPRWA